MVSNCVCRGCRPTHKCQCRDIVVVFELHVVVSSSQHQKSGTKIIRKNVLSIISNLNIKHLIENQHISITGPNQISTKFTTIRFILKDFVLFLY